MSAILPSDEQEQPKPAIHIVRPELVTNTQVATLLGILNNVVGPLVHVNVPDSDAPSLDGGVKVAMESVAIDACNQLQSILRDKSRWDLSLDRKLEKSIVKFYESHSRQLDEQTKLLKAALVEKLMKLNESKVVSRTTNPTQDAQSGGPNGAGNCDDAGSDNQGGAGAIGANPGSH